MATPAFIDIPNGAGPAPLTVLDAVEEPPCVPPKRPSA